ncbi:uncharacterized protein K452DRAFT_300778 [Aplosporella prunicola CBS 121167]|uniref:BZIP domain-containing protein n=1 Tax=Aplosporella prunicola CBS 121167 TaxID=1176127 RepID=A0A6A6B5I4_9PEZI|nr:uncharacterized protein K452DRAFT_300778 [Aplosporella prunicola CBS 121167]KAF2138683.1 hypothetical protein K452DRAFT_300778 [Aplosporella prunicola CBS 121167]
MSGFAGRKGQNVSQYLQGLNTIPTRQDMATQQDNLGFDEDLSLFTNTEFFDFDLGTEMPAATFDYDATTEQQQAKRRNTSASYNPAANPVDFPLNGDFQGLDFSFPVGITEPNFAHQQNPYPVPQHRPSTSSASPLAAASPVSATTGNKRKLDALATPPGASAAAQSVEDMSRFAAEEDKRRRNTAASARFRVKKKQREQQLEKTAKEMTDKVSTLESRIAQLELENKWLKGLITEKNDGKGAGDIADLYKKTIGTTDKIDERSNGERTDGVGTKSDDKA